jgi:hypothetical protein
VTTRDTTPSDGGPRPGTSPGAALGAPERGRGEAIALAAAFLMHALVFVVVTRSDVKPRFERAPREPIAFEIIEVVPPPVDDTPPVVEEPPVVEAPPVVDEPPTREAPPVVEAPETPPVVETPPETPVTVPPTVTDPAPTTNNDSIMRLPKGDGRMGKLLGADAPFAANLQTLEGALDIKADGPMSDAKRASKNAKRNLQRDMADDEVTAGLADDYFRELRTRVETNWRPEMKQLNDGGESVTQFGMMRDVVAERAAWDEMWKAYLDLAKMYAQGQRPKLEQARQERLRELMRSRKGMFRFHAISELVLTQGPDGKVVTIEMPLPSGHPGIDEGAKDAIATAVNAMVDAPPARVTNGHSFTSTWRMRATWTMVPPTAFLTGAGFDITPKGITVDVPFDIKLKTAVLLMRTDSGATASDARGDGEAAAD